MVTHADEYELFRKLQSLDELILNKDDRLKLVRKTIFENISKAFEASAKRYNLRSSSQKFNIGNKVYRRNFVLSDKVKRFSAKFAPTFINATVVGTKGNCMYILEDENTKRTDIYHAKDITIRKT